MWWLCSDGSQAIVSSDGCSVRTFSTDQRTTNNECTTITTGSGSSTLSKFSGEVQDAPQDVQELVRITNTLVW